MRLGIDLDGVVCDFNAGWMQLHMAEFGSELKPEMVVSWDNLHELGGFADMPAFWRWAQATRGPAVDLPAPRAVPRFAGDAARTPRRRPPHRHPHGQAAVGDPRHVALDRRPRAADRGDPHPLPQVRHRVRRLSRRLADRAARPRPSSTERRHLPDDPAVERPGGRDDRHRRLAVVPGIRRVPLTPSRESPGGSLSTMLWPHPHRAQDQGYLTEGTQG